MLPIVVLVFILSANLLTSFSVHTKHLFCFLLRTVSRLNKIPIVRAVSYNSVRIIVHVLSATSVYLPVPHHDINLITGTENSRHMELGILNGINLSRLF